MRAFLRKQLDDQYQVRVATNGEEAWAERQKEPPDLLISDTEMPELDGPALCKRLKDDPDLRGIPVILLPSSMQGKEADEKQDALTLADDVLAKPFAVNELRQRVGRYLPTRALPESFGQAPGAFLKEVVGVIDSRLEDPDFKVEELADALDLSRRHLTRRLKEAADETPAALIQSRRIERAKAWLETDPNTIVEVVEAGGFRSPSHFSKCFRQHEGCSPTTYVERHAS